MADATRSDSLIHMWRSWSPEQRAAAVGSFLLIVSTIGPFSWVEVAIVLIGVAVLLLLRRRAQGRAFHLPFGDGIVIAAAGAWSGVLIVIRLFDRPIGQGLLALVCAAILVLAGLREHQKRPPDDIPADAPPPRPRPRPGARLWTSAESETVPIPEGPVEYRPPGEAGQQEELPGLSEEPTRRLPPDRPQDPDFD